MGRRGSSDLNYTITIIFLQCHQDHSQASDDCRWTFAYKRKSSFTRLQIIIHQELYLITPSIADSFLITLALNNRIFPVEDFIKGNMNQPSPNKYSIKQRLAYLLSTPAVPLPSKPKIDPSQDIFRPQHYDYFLRTVEKEIRHEGDLLTKIQSSINNRKSQKRARKDPQNQVKNYSHNALTNSFAKHTHNRNKTAQFEDYTQGTTVSTSNTRCINSASCSARNTLKIKESSLSTQFPKRLSNPRCFSRNLSNIMLKTKPEIKDEQYRKPWLEGQVFHKKSKTGVEMSVMGSSPHWQQFECYRNNGVSMVKKWLD